MYESEILPLLSVIDLCVYIFEFRSNFRLLRAVVGHSHDKEYVSIDKQCLHDVATGMQLTSYYN